MKPDGVATTLAEPADDVVEPVPDVASNEEQAPPHDLLAEPVDDVLAPGPDAAANEEQVQQDWSLSQQPEKPEKEGAKSTVPPPGKEVNGKLSKFKDKTKAPVKTNPGIAATKATTTTGAASRLATAQSRVANGVIRSASNGASKKPVNLTSEMKKKSAPIGTSAQVKKVPVAKTVAPRTQVKAAEQKARPVPCTSNGMRKTAAATSTLGKKPVAGGSNAAFKPKTTEPKPTTTSIAKASISAASKAAPIPKKTGSTVATASRPTTSSAPVRLTTTASKSTTLRTTIAAADSASTQSSKVSNNVAAKKDIKTTTSAAARNPLASANTRSTATKVSKPESLKPGIASKRLPTDTKKSQPKLETRQVPTRKVPPSPRNVSSRPASGRMAAELSNHKKGVTSNLVSVKHQTVKQMQSFLPLVIKEKPSEEQSLEPVEPCAILETIDSVTAAALAPVESVMETQNASVELAQPDQQTSELVEVQGEGVQVPISETTNVDTVSTVTIDAEPLDVQSESEKAHDILVVAQMSQEMTEQEPLTASLCEVPNTAQVPLKDFVVIEKQEQIHNFEDEEEEEREGSQQVSVSDMSGTQPTEESRPGSGGLAGSVWRAGGLPSEIDSEDVSCSQQGASELSAPGVLEGTESMDDLGEASLKGADGEGASAGSPDFEKFPDIPINEDDEDDEDDDRVDDMEVGSEMTEDPHRQCNDNEDEEEDDDVEMASEGVTESGLESYGNADEDDLAEDYRLDNLNRMQPSSIVPTALSAANPFTDAWVQSLQPDLTLVSSCSSNPWQTHSELPSQPATQACLDIGRAKTDLSSPLSPTVIGHVPSSPHSSEPAAEIDMGLKQGLASHSQHISQSSTLPGAELAIHTCSDASTPEELKDNRTSPGLENQKPSLPVSLIPVALPDIMQDLAICRPEHEEEPEILPADDMFAVVTSAPSSHSSATANEASDTEGDMQISDPTEPGSTGNECFVGTQVGHSKSALVEECEEACVELEGGGGSDTPQSATSAASYGFEYTTSNSNAQSTTESCIKSPGIFSLENEESLPDEAKDPSPIKELILPPAGAPADADLVDQQTKLQVNSEQQYMLCGKVPEELPEPCSQGDTVPSETGLDGSPSSEHQKDLNLDAPHPYYSTTCEKTDGFTGSDIGAPQQGKVPTFSMTRPPKHHSGLRVDHVTRLPIDLPPRIPNLKCNAQLRRLEQHQQQLEEIEHRREQQNRRAEGQSVAREGEKGEKSQGEGEIEQENKEEKVRELEDQRRDLLHLQIQQQQQELKQRQQVMQWQQELEQHQQQSMHQNSLQKNLTTVLLSPSGLCTIYEALETSDAEEDQMEEREMILKIKLEHECSPKESSSIPEVGSSSDNPDYSLSQSASPSPNLIKDPEELVHSVALGSPSLSGSSTPEQPSPLELEWNKKADIVQQLINQTLLLNGDNCSPLLLLPGGAARTLSPLEASLWPNLSPLTPPSATVTSVSSFSAEISGSSPQGEWTVVELETHH